MDQELCQPTDMRGPCPWLAKERIQTACGAQPAAAAVLCGQRDLMRFGAVPVGVGLAFNRTAGLVRAGRMGVEHFDRAVANLLRAKFAVGLFVSLPPPLCPESSIVDWPLRTLSAWSLGPPGG